MNSGSFSDGVKNYMLEIYSDYCLVDCCLDRAVDFHHKLNNTKSHREMFPLFINSPFNCAPVCRNHHNSHAEYPELNISEDEADVYENYLKGLIIKHGGKV